MPRQSKSEIIALSSIGIDIGKDVFHIVGFDPNGNIVIRRKIKRLSLEKNLNASSLYCWHGSLPKRTFCQPYFAKTRL